MINTEFGRLVATGAAVFAFVLVMSYLRLRMELLQRTSKPAPTPARQSALPAQ